MTVSDPLRAVWDALEHAGCDPHGKEYDFRARCPGHQGENREALHVSEGADRRAVLWCFRGCETSAVADALGLGMRDLFVPGHPQNRRRTRARTTPKGKVDLILEGFALLKIPVRGMWVADRCPYCLGGGLWLLTDEGGKTVTAECASGCNPDDVIGALETQVAIAERMLDGTC